MLEFAKVHIDENDKSDQSASIRTSYSVTNDGLTMIAIRLIAMKGKRLVFSLDGTVGDLARKVNDTTKMPDDAFAMYSDIQFASLTNDDVEANDAI